MREESPISEAALADIDRSLVHGIAWMGMAKWSGQLVAWVSTLVVARLLTPSDYGLVGMAALYLGALTIVAEFGIGAAIVTLRTLTQHQIRQINTVSILLGGLGYLLSCALAYPLAAFFKAPELPLVIIALSSTFLIASFRSVPWALLQRDMRFKRIAAFEGIQAIALAVVSVVLAALGFRYWTLVIAAVLSSLVATAFALALHRVTFAWPVWSEIRSAMMFSREIILQRVAWFSYSNADFLIAGRTLGQSAYGAYSMACTLANTPIDKIGILILQVSPSILSAVQTDKAAIARYVMALTEVIALVIFPLLVGLTVVADEFVPLVLGEQWSSMVVPLQILCLYGCFRSVLPLLSQVLIVTGEERFAARNMVLAAVIMPFAFYFGGTHWGLTGLAIAWAVVHPLIAYRLCRVAFDRMGTGFIVFSRRTLWPAISACLWMTAVVLSLRFLLPAAWPDVLRMMLQIVAGAVAYSAALLIVHRQRIQDLREFVTKLRALNV